MNPPIPSLLLVRANSDSSHVRFLSGLNNPDEGVLSVRARPVTRRFGWLVRSILEAVGKDRNAAGKGRNDQEEEAFLAAWLVAHDITDLVVAGVEVLPERLVHDLASLTYTVGIRTWLVADHHLPESIFNLSDCWPVRAVTEDEFNSYWYDRSQRWTRVEPQAPGRVDVAVPDADFPIFYSELGRLLPEEQASVLQARYRQEFDSASGLFTCSASGEITEEGVASYIRERLKDCPTRAEMITTVRAVQAAAFAHYWFVKVDFARLVASGAERLSALISNPATWRTLRAYRQTYRPVVCALVAAGLDLKTIHDLPAAAISDDYRTVTVAGRVYEVPSDARVFLRAHVVWRSLNTRSERFIAPPDADSYGIRTLARAVDDAASEFGLVFSPGALTRKTMTARLWVQRHGISVQPLDRPTSDVRRSA